MKTYKPGVYRISERSIDAKSPIIYFNGQEWFLPGWECGMSLEDSGSSYGFDREVVKELIWEDGPEKQWWVVDREANNLKQRGPFKHQETAEAVRAEMERTGAFDFSNLWVTSLPPEQR